MNSLEVIRSSLAWKVGNGNSFRIGRDPWSGCGNEHILSLDLVDCLDQSNIQYLSRVGDLEVSTIIIQGWKLGISLGLSEIHSREWDIYVLSL